MTAPSTMYRYSLRKASTSLLGTSKAEQANHRKPLTNLTPISRTSSFSGHLDQTCRVGHHFESRQLISTKHHRFLSSSISNLGAGIVASSAPVAGKRSYYTYSREPFHPLKRDPKWQTADEAVSVVKSGENIRR